MKTTMGAILKKIGRYLIFISLLFLIFSVFLFSEVSVTAELSDKVIGVGEPFTLTITINAGKADEVNIPKNIEAINLISTPQSKNFTFNNGTVNTLEKYYYIFIATKEGKYSLEGISVKSKRKVYDIDSLEIEVIRSSTRSPNVRNTNPEEENEYAKNIKLDDVYVQNKISKNQVYLNEAVYITQKAYTRVPIKVLGVSSLPDRKDFFYMTDKSEYTSTREIINGVNLSIKPLKIEVLYPLKTGKKEIETTSFVFKTSDSFLNDQIERGREFFEIEVLPLPKEGKPRDFSGAVGRFNFNVFVNEKNINIGDTVVITVQAEGDGNISVIDIPKIDTNLISKFFTVYTPKIYETNFFDGEKIISKKSEEYVFAAKENGSANIESLIFNYFSPEDKKYKTIVSDNILINIAGVKSTSVQKNNITYIMPIKNKMSKDISNFNMFKSLYFYIYISFIVLISFSVILFFKNKDRKKSVAIDSYKTNKNELIFADFESTKNIKNDNTKINIEVSIESGLKNRKEYLKYIEMLFKKSLCEKLEIKEHSQLNHIIKTMNEKNIDKEVIDKVKNILNTINEEIYSEYEYNDKKENKNYKEYTEEIKYIINYLKTDYK